MPGLLESQQAQFQESGVVAVPWRLPRATRGVFERFAGSQSLCQPVTHTDRAEAPSAASTLHPGSEISASRYAAKPNIDLGVAIPGAPPMIKKFISAGK